MERLTNRPGSPAPGLDEALDRLARFEDSYDEVVADQARVTVELERLRREGRTKTVRFRELLGRKLTNAYVLVLWGKHGIS